MMPVRGVQGPGVVSPQELTRGGGLGPQPGGTSFADTLKNAVGGVVELQDHAKDVMGMFLRGEHVELHEVMAAAEEAGLALEMLIEMRNKVTEAYRSVINMQS